MDNKDFYNSNIEYSTLNRILFFNFELKLRFSSVIWRLCDEAKSLKVNKKNQKIINFVKIFQVNGINRKIYNYSSTFTASALLNDD